MNEEKTAPDIVHPSIVKYMNSLYQSSTGVLADMEAYAEKNDFPIVGPQVGCLLALMVKLTRAARIFEMGSGFGYSAYFMASALRKSGKIVCTDLRQENLELARGFLRGVWDKIDFKVGNALEILALQSGSFDIIFNDIEKIDYPKALEIALPRLASGGLFIIDNVLWDGKVAQPEINDKDTQAVRDFNKKLMSHPQLETVILPLRDGLAVACKKSAL